MQVRTVQKTNDYLKTGVFMISLWARFKRLTKIRGAMFCKPRCVCMFAPPLQQRLNKYPH